MYQYDVLIIGAGAAGMSLALQLPSYTRIALLSKGTPHESATAYAQGGIAAVIPSNENSEDSVAQHEEDTCLAGGGLCDREMVRQITQLAPQAIQWLLMQGVIFSRKGEGKPFHLTQEGGHSHRRILHAADATGRAVADALVKSIQSQTNIDLFSEHTAVDVVCKKGQCVGAYVLDNKKDKVEVFQAKFTVLATGGASKVYLYTSNPDCSTGDGIAIAWRAGCEVSHLEFNQFHPTCLYHPQAKSFLLTEALRGEGAKIVLPNGQRFLQKHHPKAELAPRDVVARAIDFEMKYWGIDHVNLDITHKSKEFILDHFPTVYKRCLSFGIDITKEPVPIVPAAHYTCGGVKTDIKGTTTVKNLYAIGEVACTGLHGGNRLASNSLLECVVMGGQLAKALTPSLKNAPMVMAAGETISPWDVRYVTTPCERVTINHSWQALRRLMWDYVGIAQSKDKLQKALTHIQLLKTEVQEYYSQYYVSKDLLELRNLIQVAELITLASLRRMQEVAT